MKIILILSFLISHPSLKTDFKNIYDAGLSKRVLLTGTIPFVLSFSFDRQISTSIQSLDGRFYKDYFSVTNEFGGKFAIAGIITTYAVASLTDNDKLQDFSATAFESMFFAGTTTMVLKILIGRARPNFTDDPYSFSPLNLHDYYQSLPSGHTTIAFAWLTVLSNYYGENKIVRYGSYTLAASTALARVYKNRHWLSDTVLGAMIGYYFGKKLSELHLKGGKE